jgi:hypothetical protein
MLPISRVFIGLNDLAIERGSASLFSALVDGTVDRVRAAFEVPVGVAGLTVPDAGDPLPCRLMLGELARLRCGYTFLRRSFRRDILGRDLHVELPRIHAALDRAARRSAAEVQGDRADLVRCVHELEAAKRTPSAAFV